MTGASVANAWMRSRAAVWDGWLRESDTARKGMSVEQAQRRIERYRAIARDLATARQLLPASSATSALESVYLTAHSSIDVSARLTRERLLHLFRDEIPAAIRDLRSSILWLAFMMFASAFAGWWLIGSYPDLIGLIASPRMIQDTCGRKIY